MMLFEYFPNGGKGTFVCILELAVLNEFDAIVSLICMEDL